MLLARLQHEVEDLKRKVEETKMKLAAEMKVGGSQVHSVNTAHAQMVVAISTICCYIFPQQIRESKI